MSYSTLEPQKGYLQHFTVLFAEEARRAESDAKTWLDGRLLPWVRPSWAGDPPDQIANAHNAYAAGLYLKREAMKADPYGGQEVGQELLMLGDSMVTEITDAGGPVVDGERLPKSGEATATSGRSVGLSR